MARRTTGALLLIFAVVAIVQPNPILDTDIISLFQHNHPKVITKA
jgi:hypothetical protein